MNYSPIVIDLNGDGVRMSDASRGALFDIDGFGDFRWLGWPQTADDAWLALDRNANGWIDSGAELFGNTTRLRTARYAEHGYEALSEFDENGDLVIDSRDSIWSLLLLWTDANRDGVSQLGELISLEDAGLIALSTEARESARRDQFGNRYRYRAKVFSSRPPRQRFSYDVFPVTLP